MFCRKCGNELADSARFCGKCGTEAIGGQTPSNTGNMYPRNHNQPIQSSNTIANLQFQSRMFLAWIVAVLFITISPFLKIYTINTFGLEELFSSLEDHSKFSFWGIIEEAYNSFRLIRMMDIDDFDARYYILLIFICFVAIIALIFVINGVMTIYYALQGSIYKAIEGTSAMLTTSMVFYCISAAVLFILNFYVDSGIDFDENLFGFSIIGYAVLISWFVLKFFIFKEICKDYYQNVDLFGKNKKVSTTDDTKTWICAACGKRNSTSNKNCFCGARRLY